MIKSFLKWAGRHTRNVQAQAACALLYGLLELFGVTGTIAIVMKLRKLKQPRKPREQHHGN